MLDLFGHISFMLIALSFWLRDILLLRTVSIIASIFAITYHVGVIENTMWTIVFWNAVFICIHGIRITMSIREKMGISFSDVEKELYETIFQNFTPLEFMKLMRISKWNSINAEKVLTTEGQELHTVKLLYSGMAEVSAGGNVIASLKNGSFIGEMSFDSNSTASATVKAVTECTIIVWDRIELRRLLQRNPSMKYITHSIFAADMAKKLRVTA
jgi:hypothetical protein